MRNMYYVDMHCHPAVKPYSWGKSIKKRNLSIKKSKNPTQERNVKTSIWYNDPPNGLDRALNKFFGLTKFTQSDFRTLTKGNVKIISACLSPIERGLFIPIWPIRRISRGLIKFVVEFSLKYIKLVRKKERFYFDELKKEYEFYISEAINQDKIFPNRFELTKNYSEIKKNLGNTTKDIISVFFSIEGCHVFNNSGLKSIIPAHGVLKNIQKVKDWDYPPLYVSIAHHMNNGLCGHAKSLTGLLGGIINQKEGMKEGFSEFGEEVLHKLLKEEPRRIYIDIKHMNVKSRIEYYKILETDDRYKGKRIPVLVSHGAVNGRKLIKPWKGKKFNTEDINFFDDEIIRIHSTGGFLGIQLDERRLCPITQERSKRWRLNRAERLSCHSKFVWNQISHIAEVLDNKGLFGWGTATIGSDYDGIVDSLNGYWTSDYFGIFEENLLIHASKYLNANPLKNHPNNNPIDPEEVVNRFMRDNALQFLKNFY